MACEPVARSDSVTAFIPELERLIAEVMEEWKVPGLAVAVVQNGEVAFIRPDGLRDVEAGLKVTTDTQFQARLRRKRSFAWSQKRQGRTLSGPPGMPPTAS